SFRQGTEPLQFETSNDILSGFRPGVGPFMPVRDGDGPSNYIPASLRQQNRLAKLNEQKTTQCKGEIISGRCYTFNPTRLPFLEAQDSCKRLSLNAELASVTSKDLHSRLVSMVTNGGKKEPVMTWLGGTVKRGSWLDGAEWGYSDWMPGQPSIHTDKPACVEMFRMDETWWSAVDCDLKRASICSYSVVV
uniref:C-type lectin domain-containing protein n=1 Tax=Periophthalmus magnuspinnatus TaxID=409849 RepID=A0A3B4AQF5_9GOBI